MNQTRISRDLEKPYNILGALFENELLRRLGFAYYRELNTVLYL